jgi:SAM-dependent methyltransferase
VRDGGPAAERWREALAAWAIPEDILARAPESPWGFPVELFASRADTARGRLTESNRRALEALPEGGVVLDVGCGAGAASLPLAGRASTLVGVDTSPRMLEEFASRARAAGVRAETVEGRWPEVAPRAPVADVVVCHHVLYNAPDLPAFALALTAHARHRVVVELTDRHPMSPLNPLWLRFHGLVRPTRPTADDAADVLREAGLEPHRTDWLAPGSGGFARLEDLVAWVRRRLCLTPDRDPEVLEAIRDEVVRRDDGTYGFPPRPVVTLWWEGAAPPTGGRSRPARAPSGG